MPQWDWPSEGLGRADAARSRGTGSIPALAIGLALVVQANRCLQGVTVNGEALSGIWGWRVNLWRYVWVTLPRLVAFGLAVAWLGLWIAGRWSRRPDGPEKLGRAVGWCWIAVALSGEVGVWLFALNR